MQQPSPYRESHRLFLLPYRYGERKWEDYLLDTQALIHDGAREQVTAIARVERAVADAHSAQAILLRDFIASSGEAWARVEDQIDILTDHVVAGFSGLNHQLAYQRALLESIVERLAQIAESIGNPLATEANELVRSGQHMMERGLYREAYGDLMAAAEKRPVNPMLHLLLADLHYKVRDDGIPFDLSAAERHLQLAIRYATALRGDLGESAAGVLDIVFSTAAHLALVRGGDASASASRDAGNAELLRGIAFLRRINHPSPSSQFLNAQLLALLGRLDESSACIRVLADYSRSWIPRALLEPNLAAIADRVYALSHQLQTLPGEHSTPVYAALTSCRELAARCRTLPHEFRAASDALAAQLPTVEGDFEAGAMDAPATVRMLARTLESATSGTRAALDAVADALEAQRSAAHEEAQSHYRSADSLRSNKLMDNPTMFFGTLILPCIFFGFFGWILGLMMGTEQGGVVVVIVLLVGFPALNVAELLWQRPAARAEDRAAERSLSIVNSFDESIRALTQLRDRLAL
ncbi:MAG: hypothetical protein Q8K82_16105 [Gemmatimonadaceae bacterium]|nr:hypothetical protein [Gemmatimonadaceae bacterium]